MQYISSRVTVPLQTLSLQREMRLRVASLIQISKDSCSKVVISDSKKCHLKCSNQYLQTAVMILMNLHSLQAGYACSSARWVDHTLVRVTIDWRMRRSVNIGTRRWSTSSPPLSSCRLGFKVSSVESMCRYPPESYPEPETPLTLSLRRKRLIFLM